MHERLHRLAIDAWLAKSSMEKDPTDWMEDFLIEYGKNIVNECVSICNNLNDCDKILENFGMKGTSNEKSND